MIRHISVFTFRDTPDKKQNIETVQTYLETVPTQYPAIRRQTLARPAGNTPSLPDDAPVQFGDLIQIADFDTLEDAEGYPASEAHTKLAEFSTPMLKKVTAIDYAVPGEGASE